MICGRRRFALTALGWMAGCQPSPPDLAEKPTSAEDSGTTSTRADDADPTEDSRPPGSDSGTPPTADSGTATDSLPVDDGTDTDADGLSDVQEASLGTDPAQRDTDQDGLFDGLEVNGGDGLDPSLVPVSPLHADLLVEVDWMVGSNHTHYFVDDAVQIDERAFANAPNANPDGTTGIRLHVDRGQWGGGGEMPHEDYTSPETFAELKAAYFDAARVGIWHHAMFIHTYDRWGSSGVADFNGDDLIVSLGYWYRQGEVPTDQAGTFLHELGHNLGLEHGGGDPINYKPNYPSVMNYTWQTTGLDGSAYVSRPGDYDYSYGIQPDVTESDLGWDVDGDRRLNSVIRDFDDWGHVELDWMSVPGHMLTQPRITCAAPPR